MRGGTRIPLIGQQPDSVLDLRNIDLRDLEDLGGLVSSTEPQVPAPCSSWSLLSLLGMSTPSWTNAKSKAGPFRKPFLRPSRSQQH